MYNILFLLLIEVYYNFKYVVIDLLIWNSYLLLFVFYYCFVGLGSFLLGVISVVLFWLFWRLVWFCLKIFFLSEGNEILYKLLRVF